MTLKKIIARYTLSGDVDSHRSFTSTRNRRKSVLWYFQATLGNKTISLNYKRYGDRYVMIDEAHVELDVYTEELRLVKCRNVTELKAAIK